MTTEQWRVAPGTAVDLTAIDPGDTGGFTTKSAAQPAIDADLERLRDLQELLYIDDRYAVMLVIQGMDTSGKDGTINHLSGGISLIGGEVTNFKAPTSVELQHDFLWRIHQRTPERGRIGIFNRSHYEDVLIVRVHDLVPPPVWETRFDQINDFERMLTQNNTIVLKCFLHISNAEQRERLQARVDDPAKWWKFNPGDIKERARWPAYQAAYEAALSRCSTDHAPWYVIPADNKWFRNYAVTRLIVETLDGLDLRPPEATFDPHVVRIE